MDKQGEVLLFCAFFESCKLLFATNENSFDLESVGRVNFLNDNLVEKTYRCCEKCKSVSLHLSLFTGCYLSGVQCTRRPYVHH